MNGSQNIDWRIKVYFMELRKYHWNMDFIGFFGSYITYFLSTFFFHWLTELDLLKTFLSNRKYVIYASHGLWIMDYDISWCFGIWCLFRIGLSTQEMILALEIKRPCTWKQHLRRLNHVITFDNHDLVDTFVLLIFC